MKKPIAPSPVATAARRQLLTTEISSVQKQYELAHEWSKEAKSEAKAAKKKFKTARREAKKLKKALKALKLEYKALHAAPKRPVAPKRKRPKPAAKSTLLPKATPIGTPVPAEPTAAEIPTPPSATSAVPPSSGG